LHVTTTTTPSSRPGHLNISKFSTMTQCCSSILDWDSH
jgi:hypothetical protein